MALTWKNRQKGSPYYYLRGTIRGETVYESTGTTDPEAAEALCITRAAQLLKRSVFGAKAVAIFDEAVGRYLASGGSKRFLGTYDPQTDTWSGLVGHFRGKLMMEIDQAALDAAAIKLYPKASPETRNRQAYTPFIAVWNAGVPDLCNERAWTRPKTSKKLRNGKLVRRNRERWAPVDEFQRLYAAAAPHFQNLLLFLVLTGCRPIEAFRLDWQDVDLGTRWVVFRDTKNDEDRGTAINQQLMVMLANMKGNRKGKVFRTELGRPYSDKEAVSGGQCKTAWSGACRRAKLAKLDPKDPHKTRLIWPADQWDGEPLVLYSMRHTCATWLLMAGVQEQVKDEIIGHESTSMGRNYAHVPRAYITAAVDLLPRLILAPAADDLSSTCNQRRVDSKKA